MDHEHEAIQSIYLPGLNDHCGVPCLILNTLGKNPHTNHHVRGAIREASNKVVGHPGGNNKAKAHFMSVSAKEQMFGGNCDGLVGEHVVPVSIMVQKVNAIYENQGDRIEAPQIVQIVKEWSILAVITRNEDNRIRAQKLYHKMPADWDGYNRFARYDATSIELIPNEYNSLLGYCI